MPTIASTAGLPDLKDRYQILVCCLIGSPNLAGEIFRRLYTTIGSAEIANIGLKASGR
jgi:hypothetical protein